MLSDLKRVHSGFTGTIDKELYVHAELPLKTERDKHVAKSLQHSLGTGHYNAGFTLFTIPRINESNVKDGERSLGDKIQNLSTLIRLAP